MRAATGSLAWAIFALSWREVWPRPPDRTDGESPSTVLPPRASLPFLSIPILTAAVIGALFFMFTAYRTREPERGLVAQAVAVVCGASAVTCAATIATLAGKDRSSGPGRRFNAVIVRALLLLSVVAIAGAMYILFKA